MAKVDKIRQIVQLKQVMKRWKNMGLGGGGGGGGGRHNNNSRSDSDTDSSHRETRRRIPSGSLAVYIGPERRRFVIPTRYLNLPIFASLLEKSEEEFGFQANGGLVLPCEVGFFKSVLKVLSRDENRFGKMNMDEFLNMFNNDDFASCRDSSISSHHGFFTPLLKARV